MSPKAFFGLWVCTCFSVVGLWWGFGSALQNELTVAQQLSRGVIRWQEQTQSLIDTVEGLRKELAGYRDMVSLFKSELDELGVRVSTLEYSQ